MIAKYLPLIVICAAGVLFVNIEASRSDDEAAVFTMPADSGTVPPVEQEKKYVRDVRHWLDTLPPAQQSRARQILRDAHDDLTALRAAIRDKKAQLATLSFGQDTAPETLPRLGQELQVLRDALTVRLELLKAKLADETSIDMGKLHKDSFWLPLPQESHLN